MFKEKSAVVTFRTTSAFKAALKKAAASERRSQSNFIENLVLVYCERKRIAVSGGPSSTRAKKTKEDSK